MKISANVNTLKFPLSVIYKGFAIGNKIYLRESILIDLKSNNPKPENVGVMLHELEHRKRINKVGKWKFAWKYWTSRKYRFEEEIAANIPQMKHIKKHGGQFDIDRRAKHLNGPIYLWCTGYKKAKTKLEKIWNDNHK